MIKFRVIEFKRTLAFHPLCCVAKETYFRLPTTSKNDVGKYAKYKIFSNIFCGFLS